MANKGFKGGKKEKKKDTKQPAVKEWDLLVKKLMKGYPDKSTLMVKCKGHSIKTFFGDKLAEEISEETSELLNRPPMGVHLMAETMSTGYDAMCAGRDDKAKTGVDQCLDIFGPEFMDVLSKLNFHNDAPAKEVVKAVKKVIKELQDDDVFEKRLKVLAMVADYSSRLWGFSVAAAEFLNVAQSPKSWGNSVPHPEKQHASVRKWVKEPKSIDKLADAIAASFADKFHWEKASKGVRKMGAASSAGSGAASDSSDESKKGKKSKGKKRKRDESSDSEGSEDKKKKTNKSSKSTKKKGIGQSDSDSEDKNKKKKKDVKDKKKKSSSDSDSEEKNKKKKGVKDKKKKSSSDSDSDEKNKKKKKDVKDKKDKKKSSSGSESQSDKPPKKRQNLGPKGEVEDPQKEFEALQQKSKELFEAAVTEFRLSDIQELQGKAFVLKQDLIDLLCVTLQKQELFRNHVCSNFTVLSTSGDWVQ